MTVTSTTARGASDAFKRLGLPLRPGEIALLEALWSSPAVTVDDLAHRCAASTAEVRAALATLAAHGLVRADGGRFSATDPERSLSRVLDRMESSLRARHDDVSSARTEALRILSSYHRLRDRPQPEGHEPAARSFMEHASHLLQGSAGDVSVVLPVGREEGGRSAAASLLEVVVAHPHPGVRVLCPETARTGVVMRTLVTRALMQGAEVRVHPCPPTAMLVVGHVSACLAADEGTTPGATVSSDPPVVGALVDLLARCWETSTPWSDAPPPDVPGPLAHEILRQLAAGHKDEVIARRVGLSLRTTRRVIAEAASSIGARSRFQLGCRAVELGWLPTPSEHTERTAPH